MIKKLRRHEDLVLYKMTVNSFFCLSKSDLKLIKHFLNNVFSQMFIDLNGIYNHLSLFIIELHEAFIKFKKYFL